MKFCELLKEYLKIQNISVYQLAREANMDRSFLQGVISGQRTLPKKRISALLNPNIFTQRQIHNLSVQYFSEAFDNNKVKRFNLLENYLSGRGKAELNTPYPAANVELSKDTSFIIGKWKILNVIYSMINNDKLTTFVSNFSFDSNEINKIVYNASKNIKIANFFHFVQLDEKYSEKNIHIIFNSIYYGKIGYLTHSYQNFSFSSIMPYFIITNDYCLTYDENIECAMLCRANDMQLFLSEKINEIKKNCTPIISVCDNAVDFLGMTDNVHANEFDDGFVDIANTVCPTNITPEIIDAIALPAVKNIPGIAEQLIYHYKPFTSDTSSVVIKTQILTYEALDKFVKTGRIEQFPLSLANPVPREMRAHFLKMLIEPTFIERLIVTNPLLIKFSQSFEYQIHNGKLLICSCKDLDNPGDFLGSVTFFSGNDYIVNDFLDYIEYLSISEKVYTPVSTKKLIESFINTLSI